MKRILYVTTLSRTINAFLIPHIEMLKKDGYKVDCACCIDKPLDKFFMNSGITVHDIPFNRNPLSMKNFSAFNQLKYIQRINEYDIVHVHTPVAAIYVRLLKLRFPRLKVIYTAHGYHFRKGGSKLGWLIYYPIEKLMAKITNVTININKEDYEITKKKLKPKKCYQVNGVGLDLNNYRKLSTQEIAVKKQEIGLKDGDFVVLMIAEFNKNKNHIQLIKTMEMLKDKYPMIKAICVGDGDKLQDLKYQASKAGVEDNVIFLGFRDDINELINIADIGVLLSYREGLPRNIMELMASGRKVIATDIRGSRDIVCNESVGKLVKVGDVRATADAIVKYYLDGDKEFKISDAIEKYDVENIKNELLEIYKGLEGGEFFHEKGVAYIANE